MADRVTTTAVAVLMLAAVVGTGLAVRELLQGPTDAPVADRFRQPFVQRFEVAPLATDVAIAPDSVWVASPDTGVIQRVSRGTYEVIMTLRLPPNTGSVDLALTHRYVWATGEPSGRLFRYDLGRGSRPGGQDADPPSADVIGPPGEAMVAVATDRHEHLWALRRDGTLLRLTDHERDLSVQVPSAASFGASALEIVGDTVWVAGNDGTIHHLRSDTGEVLFSRRFLERVPQGTAPSLTLAAGGGQLWLCCADDDLLALDPATARVRSRVPAISCGPRRELAGAMRSAWFFVACPYNIYRIEIAHRRLVGPVPGLDQLAPLSEFQAVAVDDTALWAVGTDIRYERKGVLLRINPRIPLPPVEDGGPTLALVIIGLLAGTAAFTLAFVLMRRRRRLT